MAHTVTEVTTVVEAFAADYFVVQGLTPRRQRDVLRVLRQLEAFAGRPPETCDDLTVRRYITSRVADGMHVNTVRFELNAIKPFYRWCWQQRIVDADTFLRIGEVKPPRGSTNLAKPRPYKAHEIQKFWTLLDARWPLSSPNMVNRFALGKSKYNKVWRHGIHLQTQAIASLALFAGMRATEIMLADIVDVHPDNDYIVARGKSPYGVRQGYREIPYTEQGREMMGRWLEFRALCHPGHDRLWLKLSVYATPIGNFGPGHPFQPVSIDIFKQVLTRVGPYELHRFRHTCATEWLRAGVPLELVSKLLGHANITQTLGYAELVKDDVRDNVRRAEQDFVGVVGRRIDKLLVR